MICNLALLVLVGRFQTAEDIKMYQNNVFDCTELELRLGRPLVE